MPFPTPAVDPLFLSFQLALAGRYSIDRELGRGGMGVVYLAREVHLDRLVAIKLLPPEKARDAALRERFLREARLAARLSHPNIIPIHAVDEAGGFVFYVMAYIDGETLAHRVRTRGPLPASEGVRLLREAAWALAHAHAQGVVHRDVKPDNILIEAGSGRALVADFGIAAAAGDATGDGISGTPEFMSPEQALGKQLDARSDLYALGVTAFYALSGRLPFEGASPTQVLARQVTEPAPALGSMGTPVPRKVALLIDRCLAKEPEHRPASADALAEQLGVALEQRRDVPAALRAFVKRTGRLDGGFSLMYPFVMLSGSIAASVYYGVTAGFGLFVTGMTAPPFAYLVRAARHAMLLGFTHDDLGPAFNAEIEQSREEHAVEYRREASTLEKVLKVIAGISVPVYIPTLAWFVWESLDPRPHLPHWLVMLFGTSGVIAVTTTVGYLTLLQRRRDVDTEFWSRLWTGRVGKLPFSVARKLLGHRVIGSAMTHRATELSLGLAAENLFEGLPKETQEALAGLPEVLRCLQSDAQNLRKRYDELQEGLAAAGDAGATEAYSDLRLERDVIHGKLGDAVGALETIRLNLLRLHAGSGSVEGLTTHLGLAADVSAEIGRMLEARAEVERGLVFPREIALSPQT